MIEALCGPQFETIESLDTKFLSVKTAVVLTLTFAKRVGDLHALSVYIPFVPSLLWMFLTLSYIVMK